MSRELYDLCRKYKYFYKKHEDVKSWDRKYHDIDLSYAVMQTKLDLDGVRDDLQSGLFKEYNVICSDIEIEREIMSCDYHGFIPPHPPFRESSRANVELRNCDKFVKLLSDSMRFPSWGRE